MAEKISAKLWTVVGFLRRNQRISLTSVTEELGLSGRSDGTTTTEEKRTEIFYTEGSEELKAARLWIGADSLERAERRLRAERERVTAECADVTAHEAAHQR